MNSLPSSDQIGARHTTKGGEKKTKQNTIIYIVFVAFVAAGGGFFAGTRYQQNARRQMFPMERGNQAPIPNGGLRNGFRPVNGEIIKSDAESITVKMNDGSSAIVFISDSTQINKAEPGTSADLSVGKRVAVFGNKNADGSVTAQNIQINPVSALPITPEPTQ